MVHCIRVECRGIDHRRRASGERGGSKTLLQMPTGILPGRIAVLSRRAPRSHLRASTMIRPPRHSESRSPSPAPHVLSSSRHTQCLCADRPVVATRGLPRVFRTKFSFSCAGHHLLLLTTKLDKPLSLSFLCRLRRFWGSGVVFLFNCPSSLYVPYSSLSSPVVRCSLDGCSS